MKQYLKMKDLFPLGVVSEAGFFNINSDGDVVVDIECISFHATTEEASNYVTHAINSHDELVQMNQKLLAALEEGRRAIGEHSAPYDCYATGPITGDPFRDLVQCPACSFIAMYDDVIAKAKGGAA